MLDDRRRAAQDPLFDPFATVNTRDPYPGYAVLRDKHPIYRVAARDVWVVSRYEDIRAVAKDWRLFANSPSVDLDDTQSIVGPGSFIDMEPPRHSVFRKMLQKRFAPKHINAAYPPVVRSVVDRLIDDLDETTEVDLADSLAWPVPVGLLCTLMGFPAEDWSMLAKLFQDLVGREPGSPHAPQSTHVAARALEDYLRDAVRERMRKPGEDLLSGILAQQVEGVVGEEEIHGLCFLLFAAGTSTTAGLISNSFVVLADHPDQRRILAEEPERIANGVEEILRYDAPVHYLARRATRATELHGQHIPEGARLALLYGAANRDERVFENPDVFDVTRRIQRHLAFGEGIHFCLGAPLARLEARIVLERILARFPDYEVISEGRRSTEHTTRGFFNLPVALMP